MLMGKFFEISVRSSKFPPSKISFTKQMFQGIQFFFCQKFEDSVSIKLRNLLLRDDQKFTIIRMILCSSIFSMYSGTSLKGHSK